MSDAAITLVGVAVGGLLAGAVSVVVTLMTAKATDDRDRLRFQHEARLAAEGLRQGRIERAYLHLLAAVNEVHEVIETDRLEGQPPEYEAITSRLNGVWAAMDAFGSPAAHEVFGRLRSAWLLFTIDIHNARLRAGNGPADRHDLKELQQLRQDARLAANQLRAQVAAELRGEEGSVLPNPTPMGSSDPANGSVT